MAKTPFVTKEKVEEIVKSIPTRFICMMKREFVPMRRQ